MEVKERGREREKEGKKNFRKMKMSEQKNLERNDICLIILILR